VVDRHRPLPAAPPQPTHIRITHPLSSSLQQELAEQIAADVEAFAVRIALSDVRTEAALSPFRVRLTGWDAMYRSAVTI
jgi:hypothetical protein